MFDFKESNSKTNDDKVIIAVILFAVTLLTAEAILLLFIASKITPRL